MNENQKQFLFCLRLLYKIIQDNEMYSHLFNYIKDVKHTKNPKTFGYLLEDPSKLYLLQRIFETQVIKITSLSIQDIIEQLAVQFSTMSSLAPSQWDHLINSVIHAHYRIYNAGETVESIEIIHKAISANPWTLMILLIEILPNQYECLVFPESNLG